MNDLQRDAIQRRSRRPGPRRIAHLFMALGGAWLATLLLIAGGRAAAPATPPYLESAALAGSQRLHAAAPDIGHGGIDEDDDDGDDDDNERKVFGWLANTVTGFSGDWVLAIDDREVITVLVTAQTDVRKFGGNLPAPGDWLEAEGEILPDGRIDATRVRPDDFEANQVIVRLEPTGDPGAVAQDLALAYDMTVSTVLPSADIYLFTTEDDEESEVANLLTDEAVAWAEINWISRAPSGDPYRTWNWGAADLSGYTNQTAYSQINLAPAAATVTGVGVTVAILDTGIDLQHPMFSGHLLLLNNSDLISDTNTPDDVGPGLAWGHGTHVAGVIHALAPDAQLMPLRILDSQGRGNTFVLAYAIELAVANGADVINLSLGADCRSQVLADTIAAALAQGVLIVAAAGNDGNPALQCPAGTPGVIGVAAVDAQKRRAIWSNYGGWVDLAAPGVGITSTFPFGLGAETNTGPGYAAWSGTSMATPFVTGAAALTLQKNVIAQANLSARALATHLIDAGDDISALNPAPFQVGNHLNIGAAVNGLLPEPEPTPPPGGQGFQLFLPSVNR